jgi:flagellar assembly protein FliH
MPIVKNTHAARIARDAVVLDLGDLRRQTELIIANAQREAERIIHHGRDEARRLIAEADRIGHEQGLARGRDEGRAAGLEEGRATAVEQMRTQLDGLVDRWASTLGGFDADRQRLMLEAQQDVLALSLAMGRKIVHRVPAIDPTVVQDQVREAIAIVLEPSAVTIAVHPDDRTLVQQVIPELTASLPSGAHVSLVDDASIERGGCVVRTGRGVIDARLDVQLDRVVEALLPGAAGGAA